MHSKLTRVLLAGGAAASLLLTASTAAGAYERSGDGDSDRNRGRASSYINPDTGAATANPDVNANSSCFDPDQYDQQAFSPPGTATKSLHNDACFLDDGVKVDGPASFQSKGVGFISACPDPDNAGPKVAALSDRNGDGRNDLCFQNAWPTLPELHAGVGLAGYFEAYAISAVLGCTKPDPRMYRHASDALGVEPRRCLFVDDSPPLVEAALVLGYQGCAVLRDGSCHDSILSITDLRGLLEPIR